MCYPVFSSKTNKNKGGINAYERETSKNKRNC